MNELTTHDSQVGSVEASEQTPVPVLEMPAIPPEIQLGVVDSFSLRGILSDCISGGASSSASGGDIPPLK